MVEHLGSARTRRQIRQLETLAGGKENDRRPRPDADVAEVLSRHFLHVGEDLTCAKANCFCPRC
jgi:hypothetical protein